MPTLAWMDPPVLHLSLDQFRAAQPTLPGQAAPWTANGGPLEGEPGAYTFLGVPGAGDRALQLLPMCAACKKVRDGQGRWEPVEGFLRRRLGLLFSHGLCPDCARRLYPELEQARRPQA